MARVFSNPAGNAVQHGVPGHSVLFRLDGRDPEAVAVFITERIVRAHGGEITVTSSEADGTMFRIRMPRPAVSAAGGSSPHSGGPHEAEAAEESAARSPASGPVLVVDDDPDIREALADLLIDRGLPVVTAMNGADALQVIRGLAAPPSVVLLDIMMPVMDGYGFLDERRADPALSAIPVAVITAGHGVDHARIGELIPVLPKPLDVARLMETVRRLRGDRSA